MKSIVPRAHVNKRADTRIFVIIILQLLCIDLVICIYIGYDDNNMILCTTWPHVIATNQLSSPNHKRGEITANLLRNAYSSCEYACEFGASHVEGSFKNKIKMCNLK